MVYILLKSILNNLQLRMYFQSKAKRRSIWNGKNDKILASLDTKMRNVKPEADVQIVVCQLNTDFAFDIGTSKGINVM